MPTMEVGTPVSESSTLDASPIASKLPEQLQASLEDALAQLDVARQQRAEASSQLFKARNQLDELREQKAQLQSELNRRLNSQKEAMDRVKALQDECDSMRRKENDKQNEIIELSSRIQHLMSKLESTEQYNALKDENEWLWRQMEDLKKYQAMEKSGELGGGEKKWRDRFSAIELALSEAVESRRAMLGEFSVDNDDVNAPVTMLRAVLEAEEKMRKSVQQQLSALRVELRSAKDAMDELSQTAAEKDVAAVKLEMESAKLADAQRRIADLERNRDTKLSSLITELEAARRDSADLRCRLSQTESSLAHVVAERDSAGVEELRAEVAALKAGRDAALLRAEEAQQRATTALESAEKLRDALNLEKALARRAENERKLLRDELAKSETAFKTELEKARHSEELRVELTERGVEIHRLESRIAVLDALVEREREEFKERNEEFYSTEARLEQQTKSLKAALETEKRSAAALKREVAELRRTLAHREDTADQGDSDERASRKAAESRVRELEAQISSLGDQTKRLESQVKAAENRVKEAEGRAQSADQNRKVVEEQAQTKAEQLRLAEEKLLSAQDQLQAAQAKQHAAEEKLQAAIERFEPQSDEPSPQAQEHLEEAQDQLRNLQTRQEALESQLQSVQFELDSTLEALRRSKEETEVFHTRETELSNELAESLENRKRVESDLKEQLKDAQAVSERLKEDLEAKRQSALALSAKVESLEAHIEGSLESNLKNLIADSLQERTPQDQVVRLKMCLSRMSGEIKDKESLLSVFEGRCRELEQSNAALKAQIQKVEEEWKQEYEQYLTHLSGVTASLDRVNAEKNELLSQLSRQPRPVPVAKKNRSSQRLDGESSSTTSTPSQRDKEKEHLVKEKKNLEKVVEEMKRKNAELEKDVQTLRSKVSAHMYDQKKEVKPSQVKSSSLTSSHQIAMLMTGCFIAYLAGSLSY
eukprot:Protomagalhaensia_sp_Gyna_25__2372@NODE_230_length_4260_cov_76_362236_g180_i0_p1_GENE_NODE_230_length_4260_cov_76_362236_g180_i0NODE_230_length_4260_cov_76_362236_g180_i0_p1_ORF_typecomplete_len944_score252_93DUF3584/PF12128_8/0_019DUF3584/PF12128_8/11DUF3584/PF12128_8/0_0044HOOK/PF05622_12/0_02HOOK/PF05622_12/0_027Filament/PF00038_21/10Filament/PF00038_21/1_2e02Filament/PF00038_21/0_11Filament/PF00038_21/22Filament/PF00038_21/1_9e03Filament/PF00038_21/1_5e03Filament/PF00038_21/0_00023Tropomyosi